MEQTTYDEARLPAGIAAELEAAFKRTGRTQALTLAAERLPRLLRMAPAEFEDWAGRLYHELSKL